MRHIILIVTILTLFSCSQNDTKQKELELKERELAIKEKELGIKENDTIKKGMPSDTKGADNSKTNQKDSITKALTLTPLKISGDIGQITFSQNNKTAFYYDASTKKGKIILNGVEYVLKLQSSNVGYKFTGSDLNITTTQGKWEEMESDCGYGKSLVVTIKMGTQVLKLDNVAVQDCASMVE